MGEIDLTLHPRVTAQHPDRGAPGPEPRSTSNRCNVPLKKDKAAATATLGEDGPNASVISISTGYVSVNLKKYCLGQQNETVDLNYRLAICFRTRNGLARAGWGSCPSRPPRRPPSRTTGTATAPPSPRTRHSSQPVEGHERGSVTLGGRRVPAQRPRIRGRRRWRAGGAGVRAVLLDRDPRADGDEQDAGRSLVPAVPDRVGTGRREGRTGRDRDEQIGGVAAVLRRDAGPP